MRLRLLLLLVIGLVLLPSPAVRAADPSNAGAALPAPLCFDVPGIQDCVDPQFRAYWEANGGLSVFGYPLSPALPEQTAEGIWLTQHFERNRLELHPGVAAPFTIQLGRLGADRLAQLGRGGTETPRGATPPGCRFFEATKRNVCEPFLSHWQAHGLEMGDRGIGEREALALWGLPLTAPQLERNATGDEVLTQWFERARFEDHGARGVLLGLLGAEVEAARRPAPAPAGWVSVRGDQLVVGDQPVRLKGINYYPAEHVWSFMWRHWDSRLIVRDLRKMRREVGANVVRVLVPYDYSNGWTDNAGNLLPGMLDRLRQFVQEAGKQQIKVIITLFDWHQFLEKSSRPFELAYLKAIVSAFKDDDRVLAWDVHNEPDNYPDWELNPTESVGWITSTADEIRALDARHPITVGVARTPTLWHAGPDGRTILDISDIVSIHNYDAANYRGIFAEIRARTPKPILLEEFGWPSGPECVVPWRDEASQLYLYQQALAALDAPGVVGGLSWWLQDSRIQAWNPVEDENTFFGVYRRDGTGKPALAALRGFVVPPLPSQTTSNLPLTLDPPPEQHPLDAPMWFGDIMIHGSFKHFWNFFGGEKTFGKPIGQQYRDQQGKLIQYFERARFELNESLHVKPIDPRWPEGQTDEVYLDRVHLTPLGRQLTAGRSFTPVSDPGRAGVLYFSQTGHTLRGAFRTLWETHGEPFFGLPLSEEMEETIDRQARTVQYFEKWRMERLPDGSVRLGNLGRLALEQRPCVRGWE